MKSVIFSQIRKYLRCLTQLVVTVTSVMTRNVSQFYNKLPSKHMVSMVVELYQEQLAVIIFYAFKAPFSSTCSNCTIENLFGRKKSEIIFFHFALIAFIYIFYIILRLIPFSRKTVQNNLCLLIDSISYIFFVKQKSMPQ